MPTTYVIEVHDTDGPSTRFEIPAPGPMTAILLALAGEPHTFHVTVGDRDMQVQATSTEQALLAAANILAREHQS